MRCATPIWRRRRNRGKSMIIQNVVFPKKAICDETELYYRKIQGSLSSGEAGLVLAQQTELSFFTYFNGFSADKWNQYTNIGEVHAAVQCQGDGEVSLWRAIQLGKELKKECLHTEAVCEGVCRIPFDCREQSGILYLTVKAKGEMKIERAYFECQEEVCRPVTIAVGICTFRREEFIIKTLDTLRRGLIENESSPLYQRLYVYVSDNGNTLPLSELSDEYVHVMANKNAGGAGGFGRCMLEAYNAKDKYNFTHILLMDDDIVLEPESILRTYAILAYAKSYYSDAMLGGALLRMDVPYLQHANGEMWQGGRIGFTKRGYDLRSGEMLMKNEEDLPMEYNGWWFCCIPLAEYFRGFPLPVFIHGDDIEYGLRFDKKIMTMNGIGVWHDAFDNRKASSMEYYDMRNTLITCAIHHPEFSVMHIVKSVCRHLAGQMLHYREEDQLLTMKGVEDFCKGVQFLKETDPISLHQEIMQMGYRMTDVSEELAELHAEKYYTKPQPERLYEEHGFSKRHLLSVNGWLLPAKKETLPIPMGKHPDCLYRYKNVLLYDPDTKQGFFVRRKRKNLFLTAGRCFRMWRLLRKNYRRAVADFCEYGKELTERGFWEEYLR